MKRRGFPVEQIVAALKQFVAEPTLGNAMLQDVLRKKL